MGDLFNIYCDESCHLEHDQAHLMMLGAVWCKADVVGQVAERVREIKKRHGMRPGFEVKWTKVSPAKIGFYLDLIDYFFDDDDLNFRGYLIEKHDLDHPRLRQTHDDWYYKMCFRMLEVIIDPRHRFCVYMDIKDTRSETKRKRLEDELRTKVHDHSDRIIFRVQQIRSHESEVLQLCDLLIGAVLHFNRNMGTSPAKRALIERIRRRSRKDLSRRTWLLEKKFNLFRWKADFGGEE
jgi:hypothetical protein